MNPEKGDVMKEDKMGKNDKKHHGHGKHGDQHGHGKHGNHHGHGKHGDHHDHGKHGAHHEKHSCRSEHGGSEKGKKTVKDHRGDDSSHHEKSEGSGSHGGRGVASVNVERCDGCGKCVNACPEDAISVQTA